MAKVKFNLNENILTQTVGGGVRHVGKGVAASLLGAVAGSPAAGLAAFDSIKNMLFDKKTYKTEQEKEKKVNEIIKQFSSIFGTIQYNNTPLTKTEISVLLDFINDYLDSVELEYRKNLGRKYTNQEIASDILVQLRKKLTHGDVRNARDWITKGNGKINNTTFMKMFSDVVLSMLPTFKNLEIINRQKAGQYYSPDTK